MEPDEQGRVAGSDDRDARRVTRRRTDDTPAEVPPVPAASAVVRRPTVESRAVVAPRPTGPVPVPWRRQPGGDVVGAAPHRLRDLGPTGRAVALALVLLLVLPGIVGLLRFERNGWVLNSDNALLGLRSLDVTGGDAPLVGQPSTSDTAGGGIQTYHPGPIEMWAFAPLTRAFGGWGFVTGGVVVNLAAVLTVAWVAFRRLGPAGGVVAAVLLGLLLRSVEIFLLTDPVSSNMWGLAVIAVAICTWAVLDGDHRLLPLAAAWASWSGQQHLSAVGPTAVLSVTALVGFGAIAVGVRRGRRAPVDHLWRWLAGAAGVAGVLWAPVIWQQLTGDPGNITAIIEYSGVEGRTTYGLEGAVHLLVRSLEPVPVLLRTDVRGTALTTEPGPAGWAVAGLMLALALAVVVLPGVARRARLLVGTGLVLAPVGLVNSANIPGNTLEVLRINLHRWVWPFSSFVVVGLVWALVDLAVRRARAQGSAPAVRARLAALGPDRAVLSGVVLTAVFVVVAIVQPIGDPSTRDPYSSQVIRTLERALRDDMGDADRVLLIPTWPGAEFSVVPALAFALERSGVAVEVPDRLGDYFGDRGDSDDWDAAYVVTAGSSRVPQAEGRLLADVLVDGRLAAPMERVAAGLRGTRPRLNSFGAAKLADLGLEDLDAYGLKLAVEGLGEDPVSGLLDPRIVDILDGGVDGVAIDPGARAELADLLADDRQVWQSRRFFLLRVEPGEVDRVLARELPRS